jgi:peptidoglycan/LPS O-acetylase OafA/YrhL
MERIAALDLLRGAAALAVAIPHFFMLSSASRPAEIISVLAVEVFFVLSGFVLGPQILRCLHSARASDLGVFLARRWMRTVPAYLFALALISVTVGKVQLSDFVRYALYIENFFAQHNANDYFPVAWSLSIEEWFYVAFPTLLMAAAWMLRGNRDRLAVLLAIGFIGVITVLRLQFGDLDDWGAHVRRVVIFRVDSIAYGFLFFMLVRRYAARNNSVGLGAIFNVPAAAVLFVTAAALAGALTWAIEESHSHLAETLFPVGAAGFGMSAILLSYSAKDAVQRSHWLVTEPCFFLGQVSYSLYLFHLSVAMTIAPRIAVLSIASQMAIYLAACLALSATFYRVFERPILAMRPGYRRSSEIVDVVAVTAQAEPAA